MVNARPLWCGPARTTTGSIPPPFSLAVIMVCRRRRERSSGYAGLIAGVADGMNWPHVRPGELRVPMPKLHAVLIRGLFPGSTMSTLGLMNWNQWLIAGTSVVKATAMHAHGWRSNGRSFRMAKIHHRLTGFPAVNHPVVAYAPAAVSDGDRSVRDGSCTASVLHIHAAWRTSRLFGIDFHGDPNATRGVELASPPPIMRVSRPHLFRSLRNTVLSHRSGGKFQMSGKQPKSPSPTRMRLMATGTSLSPS